VFYTAAFFEFFAASTGAGVVGAWGGFPGGAEVHGLNPSHNVGGGALCTEFVGHEVHIGVNVSKKVLVSFTEICEARFAVG